MLSYYENQVVAEMKMRYVSHEIYNKNHFGVHVV